jgi:acyl-CoA thioesterase FadM
LFGTPERFLAMVRAGYPVVYRAASVTFLVPVRVDGELVQGVHLTDADGALWLATYRLERQRDGVLRIKGCEVQPASGKMV